MFKSFKRVVPYGAAPLVRGVRTAPPPVAVHAIAATLVEVTNTPAYPVITQSTNMEAAQLVTLLLPVNTDLPPNSGLVAMCQFLLPAGESATPYAVPAGQHLVVTGMDINLGGGPAYIQLYVPW